MEFTDKFYLRKACEEDMNLLFEWANDPKVRQNAFHTEAIPYEEHQKWFYGLMKDEKRVQYIFMEENKPVGQIRFTIEGDEAVIGYSIASGMRGKGYGRKLCELLFEIAKLQNIHRIISLITEENTSSKIFHEKIGFMCQGTLEKVGYKHDRWLNVSFYTKSLIDPCMPQSLNPLPQIKEKAQELLDQFNQNTN